MLLGISFLLGIGGSFLFMYLAMTVPLILVANVIVLVSFITLMAFIFPEHLEPYAKRIVNYIFPFFTGMFVSAGPMIILISSLI